MLTGEPFGAYVRRRRLTYAAERLTSGDSIKLIELAFRCQYDSQEAFTRAFKRCFGITPGECRKNPAGVRLGWRHRIDAQSLGHLKEVINMEAEIREIGAFTVAGVRERFDEDSKQRIPELWESFIGKIDDIPQKTDGTTYGVCLNDDSEDGSFDYVAGVGVDRVDVLPEGIIAEAVPRQTYAVFRHRVEAGSFHESLQRTVRWIWGTWLPASKYEYVGGPDLELYPPEFDPRDTKSYLEICIPISPKSA